MIDYFTSMAVVSLTLRGTLGVAALILVIALKRQWDDIPEAIQRHFEEKQRRVQEENERRCKEELINTIIYTNENRNRYYRRRKTKTN